MKLMRSLAAKVIVSLVLVVGTPAFAGFGGPWHVSGLYVSDWGYSVTFTESQGTCEFWNGYYWDSANPRAKDMYATLLAATLASKSVYVLYEPICDPGWRGLTLLVQVSIHP